MRYTVSTRMSEFPTHTEDNDNQPDTLRKKLGAFRDRIVGVFLGDTQKEPNESRRRFLKGALSAATAASIGFVAHDQRTNLAHWLGELLDKRESALRDHLSRYGILKPRANLEELSTLESAKAYPQKNIACTLQKDTSGAITLDLPREISLFSAVKLLSFPSDQPFVQTGFAHITALSDTELGMQEYVALFTNETHKKTIALSPTGNIYGYAAYNHSWSILKTSSSMESYQVKHTVWEEIMELNPLKPGSVMSDIQTGIAHLQDIDYHPPPAVYPNPHQPHLSLKPVDGTRVATSQESVKDQLNNPERGRHELTTPYFVAECGALCDLTHIMGSAEKTIMVALQIAHALKQKQSSIKIDIPHYTADQRDVYTIRVDSDITSLSQETFWSLVFHVVNTLNHTIEGPSQRGVADLHPQFDALIKSGGYSPEDMYSNTIGSTYTIAALKESGFFSRFMDSHQKLDTSADMLVDQLTNTYGSVFSIIRDLTLKVLDTYGVRSDVPTENLQELPQGFYALIPIFATTDNISAPPKLPLENISLTLPKEIKITLVNVPVFSQNLTRAADKIP